jgi:Mycothiol maleylpyruvate isomerase N-terminal domain
VTARTDITARERQAYEAFQALCDAIPAERAEDPVLRDGWSLRDVLHHIAFWWDDLEGAMEAIRTGVAREQRDTDTENARALAEGRSRSFAEVRAGYEGSRKHLLAVWARAPEDPHAEEVFVWETVEHYQEHEPALRDFLDSLG